MGNPKETLSEDRPAAAKKKGVPASGSSSGLGSRRLAATALTLVWSVGLSSDEAFAEAHLREKGERLSPEDTAFARAIFFTTLRHYKQIESLYRRYVAREFNEKAHWIRAVLFSAIAQLVFLKTKSHAAVNSAVELAKSVKQSRGLASLTNGVLRTLIRENPEPPNFQPMLPRWLEKRWSANFGPKVKDHLALWLEKPPRIDLTLKPDCDPLALGLEGVRLSPTTFRLTEKVSELTQLPGYQAGLWWVQDVAAALPLSLMGDLRGKSVLEIGAAPGGKTMQLAAAGAEVTALDSSKTRLKQLQENLERTGLLANKMNVSLEAFENKEPFDLVVLDAPCTATGTLRRHPEIAWTRKTSDIHLIAARQKDMLAKASTFVRPGGELLYLVCALEPEEGAHQITDFLATHEGFCRQSWQETVPERFAGVITDEGDVMTHPANAPSDIGETGGWDGFFAARLIKKS